MHAVCPITHKDIPDSFGPDYTVNQAFRRQLPRWHRPCSINGKRDRQGAHMKKLVMIGNGMAGIRAIEEILELDDGMFDITIFGAESYTNYNRIRLAELLTGESNLPGLTLHDRDWYELAGITLHLGKAVTGIDTVKQQVTAEDGTTADYDVLILATGSKPFMLPVPGTDKQGVVAFRNIADTNAMLASARVYQSAAVIGGGLLGLEAAYGLLYQGMQVTVIHDQPYLMNNQLDATAGRMLQHKLEAFGMQVRTGTLTSEVIGEERATGLRFEDGSEIAADLVVMAAGIVPNADLAQQAGLACGRGITVNGFMQSVSDPAIYAVGECAECDNRTYGFVAPLFEQAKVLAKHITGIPAEPYAEQVIGTQLKVSGVNLYSAGNFRGTEGCETILYLDQGMDIYKKVVLQGNRVVGCLLFGDVADGPRLLELIRSGADIAAIRSSLLQAGSASSTGVQFSAGPTEFTVVCGCNGVTRGAVVEAIRQYGLTDFYGVMAETRAGRGCGACYGAVQSLLNETLAETAT